MISKYLFLKIPKTLVHRDMIQLIGSERVNSKTNSVHLPFQIKWHFIPNSNIHFLIDDISFSLSQ